MHENLIEDGKVVGSATLAVILDYAQIFNQLITLLISVCTLVYVANRAYHCVVLSYRHYKRKKDKQK